MLSSSSLWNLSNQRILCVLLLVANSTGIDPLGTGCSVGDYFFFEIANSTPTKAWQGHISGQFKQLADLSAQDNFIYACGDDILYAVGYTTVRFDGVKRTV